MKALHVLNKPLLPFLAGCQLLPGAAHLMLHRIFVPPEFVLSSLNVAALNVKAGLHHL